MTNTIPNVPRELLENTLNKMSIVWQSTDEMDQLRALLSAQSPAGVDGLGNTAKLLLPALRQYMHNDGSGLLAGYDLETTQAIIDGLRGEVAELQSMITNLSRAGIRMRTERDQQAQRIGELEGLLRDSAELIKHGVFEDGYCCCGSSVDSHGLGDGHSPVDALAYHAGQVCERIDAALSAGKDSDQ